MGAVASVLAIFLGSHFGFTVALLTGIGAYGLALIAVVTTRRTLRGGSPAAYEGRDPAHGTILSPCD